MRLWASWAELPDIQEPQLERTVTRDICFPWPSTYKATALHNIRGHHSHCSLSEQCPQRCALHGLPAVRGGPVTSSSLTVGLQ